MRRVAVLLLTLLLTARVSAAAIARDSNGEDPNNSTNGRATPVVWAFNNVAGDCLVLSIEEYTNLDTVTGVTYNGVAMTLLGKRQTTGGNHSTIYLWELVAPATGSHNISIAFTGFPPFIISMAFSYSGTHATQPDATAVTKEATGTSYSDTIPTVNDNAWAVWIVMTDTGVTQTAGSGTSKVRQDGFDATTAFFDSNGPVHPAAAYTVNDTLGSSDLATSVLSSLRVAGGGGGATNCTRSLLGVGCEVP